MLNWVWQKTCCNKQFHCYLRFISLPDRFSQYKNYDSWFKRHRWIDFRSVGWPFEVGKSHNGPLLKKIFISKSLTKGVSCQFIKAFLLALLFFLFVITWAMWHGPFYMVKELTSGCAWALSQRSWFVSCKYLGKNNFHLISRISFSKTEIKIQFSEY